MTIFHSYVKLPEGMSDQTDSIIMLYGLNTIYLIIIIFMIPMITHHDQTDSVNMLMSIDVIDTTDTPSLRPQHLYSV